METLMEIKAKKEHYIRGVWNANSVLLGGLGKYPDLDGMFSRMYLKRVYGSLLRGIQSFAGSLAYFFVFCLPANITVDILSMSESFTLDSVIYWPFIRH